MDKDISVSEMLKIQKEFNKKLLAEKGYDIDNLTQEQTEYFIKEYVLHIVDECFELLREINWKMHKKERKVIDRKKIIEELVDIDKFHKNFLMILNVLPEEYKDMWEIKSATVMKRFEDERKEGNK